MPNASDYTVFDEHILWTGYLAALNHAGISNQYAHAAKIRFLQT
jgi:hypothetical protein